MKKIWFVPIGIVVLGLIGGGIYFSLAKPTATIVGPTGNLTSVSSSSPTPTMGPLATWTDDAGFSFRYPKDLTVNKHEDDNENYAHVELTSKNHPGSIIVWVKDLPAGVTTLDSWVKKLYAGATTLDTKLGGEPAKKILTTTPVKMLTVGAISDNLLFSVEGTLTDSDYWSRVHDTITGSFAFTPDTSTAASASNTGAGAESVDEEEVVQ